MHHDSAHEARGIADTMCPSSGTPKQIQVLVLCPPMVSKSKRECVHKLHGLCLPLARHVTATEKLSFNSNCTDSDRSSDHDKRTSSFNVAETWCCLSLSLFLSLSAVLKALPGMNDAARRLHLGIIALQL